MNGTKFCMNSHGTEEIQLDVNVCFKLDFYEINLARKAYSLQKFQGIKVKILGENKIFHFLLRMVLFISADFHKIT